MARQRAHQLIGAAEVFSNLSTTVDKPTGERQARPLAELEPEDQRTVWEQAVADSGGEQPTASCCQFED
jgi:hypothetical protein